MMPWIPFTLALRIINHQDGCFEVDQAECPFGNLDWDGMRGRVGHHVCALLQALP
jgi:hypothetical protein